MSDRQITKAGGLKYYERKTWGFGSGVFHLSGIYAGFPEMAKIFELECERARPEDIGSWEPTQDELKDFIEHCLLQVWKKHRHNMQLEMLMCSWARGSKYKLWRSQGKVLTSAGMECIGVGDSSVIRYLFDTFPKHVPFTKLEFFVPFAVYVMQQAKKYIEGCGGRTDCTIFREGTIIHANDPRSIKEVEDEMESLEGEVVNLFGKYSDSSVGQEGFARILEKFSARIEQSRRAGKLSRLF
jgi:hypothetical protein